MCIKAQGSLLRKLADSCYITNLLAVYSYSRLTHRANYIKRSV